MRRAGGVAGAAAMLVLLAGCTDAGLRPVPPIHTAQPPPNLVELKKEAGIRDCEPGTATDSALPDLELGCLGGGPVVNLNTLRGPMIIDMFKSACDPCKEEMPALQAFDVEYGERVPVIGIDYGDSTDLAAAAALDLARDTGATFPMLADPAGETSANGPIPRFVGMPYVLFVDDTGDIVGTAIGGVDSVDELVELSEKYLGVDL